MTGAANKWQTLTAQSPGLNHIRNETECQDRWAVRHCAGGVVLAVADGVGSVRRGSTGAQFAVEAAVEEFDHLLLDVPGSREGMRDLLSRGGKAVKQRLDGEVAAIAQLRGERVSDFATTLSVVVLAQPWLGYWGVGDGFAVVETQRTVALLVQPYRGDGPASEVAVVTSREIDADVVLEVAFLPEIRAVGLSTDGLIEGTLEPARGIPDRRTPLAARGDMYTPIFEHVRAGNDTAEIVRHMLTTLSVASGDDKTLVVAVRHG